MHALSTRKDLPMTSRHSESAARSNHSIIGTEFQTVLPRLVCAYEQGRLVPFVGAGVSVPACRLWQPFVDHLEEQAELKSAVEDNQPDSLIMRANTAIGRLRALGTAVLAQRVRRALFNEQFSWGQPFTSDLICHEGSLAFDSLSLEFTDDDHEPCNCACQGEAT
jgi:hypothetical protein